MEYISSYKGKPVGIHCLANGKGMDVVVTNFGARIMSLTVNDARGLRRDVVLGFDKVEDYYPENHLSDFGAVIGRYANRLAGGRITVDGVDYQLPQNNGPNCLHGGPDGWQYKVFDVAEASDSRLELVLVSPDGDNGFPGEVKARVSYSLTEGVGLRVDYHAESDRPTVINMTNHSYFNLTGAADGTVMPTIDDHLLLIDADRYTPTDETAIPLEEHVPVDGTPFDFRKPKAIGREIESAHPQLAIGHGYDHNYVVNSHKAGNESRLAATLYSPQSGIEMRVSTNAPGVQLYTGNFLSGTKGRGDVIYPRRSAVCLETQQYPDSPNRHWPESTGRLAPDRPFDSATIFEFLVR